jgi:hypothetical protein
MLLVVRGEKCPTLAKPPIQKKIGALGGSIPSGSGQKVVLVGNVQVARMVAARAVTLLVQEAGQAVQNSSDCDEIEGEHGSKERSGLASSEYAFSLMIHCPIVTM